VSSSDKGKNVVAGTVALKVSLGRFAADATADFLGSFQERCCSCPKSRYRDSFIQTPKSRQKYMVSLTLPYEHIERASTFALIALKV